MEKNLEEAGLADKHGFVAMFSQVPIPHVVKFYPRPRTSIPENHSINPFHRERKRLTTNLLKRMGFQMGKWKACFITFCYTD